MILLSSIYLLESLDTRHSWRATESFSRLLTALSGGGRSTGSFRSCDWSPQASTGHVKTLTHLAGDAARCHLPEARLEYTRGSLYSGDDSIVKKLRDATGCLFPEDGRLEEQLIIPGRPGSGDQMERWKEIMKKIK